MDKKSNMKIAIKQALSELYTSDMYADENEIASGYEKEEVITEQPSSPPLARESHYGADSFDIAEKSPIEKSYIAPKTVVTGTVRCCGDIKIAGVLKGNIITDGSVTLCSGYEGNINASSLYLCGCKLVGDVEVTGIVTVSSESSVYGNITAENIVCAGQITGDLRISDSTSLEATSCVNGSIVTGSIAVVKGARIKGKIEINPPALFDDL